MVIAHVNINQQNFYLGEGDHFRVVSKATTKFVFHNHENA